MESDRELELLTAKKLMQLKRRLAAERVKEKTSREIVVERLVDRGLEVLEAAERMYPKETSMIVKKLAELIQNGTISEYISGGELLSLFRSLGFRVHIETTISVEKDGRFVPLSEKLRSDED